MSIDFSHQEAEVERLTARGEEIGVEWSPRLSKWSLIPPEWIFDYAEHVVDVPHGKDAYIQPIVRWNYNRGKDWMVYDGRWYLKIRYAANVASVWRYLHRQLATLGPLTYIASGTTPNIRSQSPGTPLKPPTTEYHFEWAHRDDNHEGITVNTLSIAPMEE
ncbi:hypothetical protein HUG10_21430 (plasmid) [Halorarum halophilum]|uniref:Uncharacterized protein n=1 Tax=Halorarum halophilum TaxID=2743090 RepID=A0A7D5GEZ8_9EURY|nr:hypothetical protein [Halobaculum halophilum]QLG30152.1 hypothetical protein HUG10_21430 [Halobaculum halophilum]